MLYRVTYYVARKHVPHGCSLAILILGGFIQGLLLFADLHRTVLTSNCRSVKNFMIKTSLGLVLQLDVSDRDVGGGALRVVLVLGIVVIG